MVFDYWIVDASITHLNGALAGFALVGFGWLGHGFWVCVFVVLYIVLCLDHLLHESPVRMCVFVVCVGGLCGKLVRAHGGCLGIESR